MEVMSVTRKANTPSWGSPVFVPSAVASGGYEASVGPGQSGTIWSARKGGWAFVSQSQDHNVARADAVCLRNY